MLRPAMNQIATHGESCYSCMNFTGKDISLWCGNLFYIISACNKCR